MLINEIITQPELDQVERFADALWSKIGIDVEFTRHFMDRLNDERNGKPISVAELVRLFKKEYEINGKNIAKLNGAEAVMKDLLTSINLPFVIKDTRQGKELVSKTMKQEKTKRSEKKMWLKIHGTCAKNPMHVWTGTHRLLDAPWARTRV